MKEETKQFIKDRNEALMSLDKNQILNFLKKYDLPIPKEEKIFWASTYKAIIELAKVRTNKIPKKFEKKAFIWLVENGFFPRN